MCKSDAKSLCVDCEVRVAVYFVTPDMRLKTKAGRCRDCFEYEADRTTREYHAKLRSLPMSDKRRTAKGYRIGNERSRGFADMEHGGARVGNLY
jgi:hypothetical protein